MSSQNNLKPDLDESINVSSAHVTPAAMREHSNPGADHASFSISTTLLCFLMAIGCGAVFGSIKGGLFDYSQSIEPGYVRGKPPGVSDAVALPPKPMVEAYAKKGASIYAAKCNGCHGADGKGDGANYPALAGSAWVTGGAARFALVFQNGLSGPTSTGKTFGIMPPQGAGMTPEDIAYLMTYVRNSFGNTVGDVITPEMGKAAMDLSAARKTPGAPVTAAELAEHDKALAGEKADPQALVDPVSLKPAAKK